MFRSIPSRPAPARFGDKRAAPRQRVLYGNKVAYPDGSNCVNCLVRDFSPAGARIHLDGQQSVPDCLYLIDLRHQLIYDARVAWRKAPEFGLQFLKVHRFNEVPSAQLRQLIENNFQS